MGRLEYWLLTAMWVASGCDEGSTSTSDAGAPGGTAADTGASSDASDSTTQSPVPSALGDPCDEEADECDVGLRCLFGICEYACGDAPLCCPDGMICGGIEYECRPPAEDWCGHGCDGQQWHACASGQTCSVDAQGQGTCVD